MTRSILPAYTNAGATLDRWVPGSLLLLTARLGVAGVFFMSGRTKVAGLLTIKDSTYTLFQTDYKLPLVPPDIAAYAATYSEHFFPLLLVLGLFTRVGAAALLGMTLVIEIFVYPNSYVVHGTWAAILLMLVKFGPGAFSLDYLLYRRR